MKKITFIIAALLAFAIPASAQVVMKPALDTNINAVTSDITTDALFQGSGTGALQYVGTKVSGTVAGKVYLKGSVDGVNFPVILDSLTLADQAINTKIFDVSDKRRLKWRFSVVTTGTVVLINKGYWLDDKK